MLPYILNYLPLALIALFAGGLSAIAGSSGIIILPTLLLAGIPPTIALGTNKLYTTTSLFTAALSFIRKGLFKPYYWIAATIATLSGAIVGSVLTMLINPEILSKILPVIIAFVAIYFMLPKKKIKKEINELKSSSKPKTMKSIILGGILGIYSGFLGAGTGSFWTSLSMSLFKLDILEASAVSRFMCFVSNITSLIVFIVLQQIDYKLGSLLASTGAIGAFFGSKIALRYGTLLIKPIVAMVTTFMSADLAFQAWF